MRDLSKPINDFEYEINQDILWLNNLIKNNILSKSGRELTEYYRNTITGFIRRLESESRHSTNIWLNVEKGKKIGIDYLKILDHFQEVFK